MKSAYELAMERLNKTTPTVKLTDAQKKGLVELESKTTAKIAEREIALRGEIKTATEADDFEKVKMIELQLAAERKNLQADLEEKKEKVRRAA